MFKLMVSAELDENGLCRPSGQFDHVDFFPVDGSGVSRAKAVCNGGTMHGVCPVKDECLEYALANRIDHGVWGGESERARRNMVKRRKITERPTRSSLRPPTSASDVEEARAAEHQAALEVTVQIRRELAS